MNGPWRSGNEGFCDLRGLDERIEALDEEALLAARPLVFGSQIHVSNRTCPPEVRPLANEEESLVGEICGLYPRAVPAPDVAIVAGRISAPV